MKENKFVKKAFLLLAMLAVFTHLTVKAQVSKNDKKEQKLAAVQQLIQSKKLAFVAQYAVPLGGRTINLTSVYDIKLSPDTVVAELPYYGRAFVAPINPSDGGISFTSTKFSYTISQKKKGGWEILIMPKDTQDVRQLFLTVSEEGYASLQVTSNTRQVIGFTGYVTDKSKLS